MGKTTLVFQETLHGAMKHGEVVVNYQAEMSPDQIDTILTSHLLRKDRLTLTAEDYKAAGRLLPADVKYYIGRNTSFTTMTEVLDLIEAAARRFGATVAVLDNLHFLSRNEQDPIKAQANAMQRITNMAGSLRLEIHPRPSSPKSRSESQAEGHARFGPWTDQRPCRTIRALSSASIAKKSSTPETERI